MFIMFSLPNYQQLVTFCYSTDGITWTSTSVPHTYYRADFLMSYVNGVYYVYAWNVNYYAYSSDNFASWQINEIAPSQGVIVNVSASILVINV